jgi:hypothetical protein
VKALAHVFIALGFLAGALVAVQSPKDHVAWAGYLPALALGIAGVVLARWTGRRHAHQPATLNSNRQQLVDRLDRIVTGACELSRELDAGRAGEIHTRIDRLFRAELDAFAESRGAIARLHGLAAYAEVMNEFAAGERYLNRAWSASVDGYLEEAREYVGRAAHQFAQAQAALGRHRPSGEPAP